MSLLGRLLERSDPVEARSLTPSQLAWARGDDVSGQYSPTGVAVNRDSMLSVSAVWACVSLIADAVATLPLKVYGGGDLSQPLKVQPDWLVNGPNPEQTIVDFKFGTVASLLLAGNAYIYVVRDRKQNPVELWLLDPRWTYVRRELDGRGNTQLVYYVGVAKGQQSPVGPFRVVAGPEMFHIMAVQPDSSWPQGIGPLDVAKMMFGSAIAGQEMGARWFSQGFNAAGVIEHPDEMLIEEAREIKQSFADANTGGPRKMHLPPVLTGGATWKQIQISPEQAQFLQQRQFSIDEIARWFRVPPHMIGNLEKTTSWGSGIEEQAIGFVKFTLRPWIERIEEAWTRQLLTFVPNARFRFDVSELERGNMVAQADYWLKMHLVGAYTANEMRAKIGLPPFDGGDTHFYPVNSAPIGTEPISPIKVSTPDTGLPPDPTAPPDPLAPAPAAPAEPEQNWLSEDVERRLQELWRSSNPPPEMPPVLVVRPPGRVATRKKMTFPDGRSVTVVEQPLADGTIRKTATSANGHTAELVEEDA